MITFTPLLNVHSVVPRDLLVVATFILPRFGVFVTNFLSIVSSFGAVSSIAFTSASCAKASSLVGNFTVSFSGAVKLIIKLLAIT